jgi:hypothetical protein
MNGIDWLPDMLPVNPWSGNAYEELFAVFRRDFVASQPRYRGHHVWFFNEMDDGKEAIFWHLTDKGKKPNRLPDTNRSARLSWIRPMLEHCPDAEILDWDVDEDGATKTYVWLKNHDFVVILKRMTNGSRRLLTAHHLDYPDMRAKLQKKYERRIGIGT